MIDLNLSPKLKYSTLLYRHIQDIFIIYILTREIDHFAKMIILFRVGTHVNFFLENWALWCMTDSNLKPHFKISNSYVVQIETYLVYIKQLNIYQLTKMINMFRVVNLQPFIFKNWTQWCMTGLKLTPHFKYSTILCCQYRDIFGIDIPTRAISVHKNDQHVQSWNPTTIFFENSQKFNFFFRK